MKIKKENQTTLYNEYNYINDTFNYSGKRSFITNSK